MQLLQIPADFDLRELLEGLGKFLAFFFFIGLPILKSVRDARREKREREAKQRDAPLAPSAEAPRGPTWEELLRGEVPAREAEPAPIAPPPLPAESRIPEARPLVDLQQGAPQMLSDENLASERGVDEEAGVDEETAAAAEIARREREEFARQLETVRRQRAAGSSRRLTVEASVAPGADMAGTISKDLASASAPTQLTRARGRSRLDRKHVLRAIVMSEVIGPPIGLTGASTRRVPGLGGLE